MTEADPTDESERHRTDERDDEPSGGDGDGKPVEAAVPDPSVAEVSHSSGATTTDGSGPSGVRRYVYWTALAGLVGLAAVSFLFLYSDVRTVIRVFVADEYVLLIQTAFHLVLLLLAGIGVSLLVRRLEGESLV